MNKAHSKAIDIAVRVLSRLRVVEGQTEEEVAGWIKSELKKLGARPSFRIIVASGKRSAIPHGFATDKKIKRGELVVIDFGAVYNGYRSDITRTIVVGKSTSRQRKIYRIVGEAQKRAMRAVRAGRRCLEIDRAAREYIQGKGYGKNFIHSAGHRIGKKVHEAPKISKGNHRELEEGMVVCIEPGIYIKGWGGVRIEDMMEVTKRGCRVLTR